jgi:hypothetical protein
MNLLPISRLRGGSSPLPRRIITRGRSASLVYRYQLVGSGIIVVIFVVSAIGDIQF